MHKRAARLENKHDQGTALSRWAHQLGRAVYAMLKRNTAFAMALFLRASGSRAGEPDASLAPKGMRRMGAYSSLTASMNAKRRLGPVSLSLTL